MSVVITIAPTGSTSVHVPTQPDEIADAIHTAYKLGASVAHIHARDKLGNPSSDAKIFSEIFDKVRSKCDIIICASASGRHGVDIDARIEVFELEPDMASLAMGSWNFPDGPCMNSLDTIKTMATAMKRRGIKPEIEIFEPGMINTAKYLLRKGYLDAPLYFNFVLGSLGTLPATGRDLDFLIESLPPGSTWSAAGVGRYHQDIVRFAVARGGGVRIGLEDCQYRYPGREFTTNEDLVSYCVTEVLKSGNKIASITEARKMLFREN